MIKNFKKHIILSSIVILLPVLAGLLLWNRLPATMTAMEAKGLPVITADGIKSVDYRYERSTDLPLWATDGNTAYSMSLTGGVTVGEVRFGPFASEAITAGGSLTKVERINGYYYAYVRPAV